MVPEKDRLDQWKEVLVNQLLVGEGKGAQAKVRAFAQTLTKIWEADLAGDVPDIFTSVLSDLMTFARWMPPTTCPHALQMLDHIGAAQELKKEFRCVSNKPLTVLSNTLCDNAHWLDMVDIDALFKLHHTEREQMWRHKPVLLVFV